MAIRRADDSHSPKHTQGTQQSSMAATPKALKKQAERVSATAMAANARSKRTLNRSEPAKTSAGTKTFSRNGMLSGALTKKIQTAYVRTKKIGV